jgi:hypothetical protein
MHLFFFIIRQYHRSGHVLPIVPAASPTHEEVDEERQGVGTDPFQAQPLQEGPRAGRCIDSAVSNLCTMESPAGARFCCCKDNCVPPM